MTCALHHIRADLSFLEARKFFPEGINTPKLVYLKREIT
jgi:hypothetical protein